MIHTAEDVTLLNHEYTVISDERLEEYKKLGWILCETGSKTTEPMNLELIQKGRSLCEEEREIIWALQLDGLTETRACEEYFLSKHSYFSNYTISYLPPKKAFSELMSIFGIR